MTSVKVAVRVRPLNKREEETSGYSVITSFHNTLKLQKIKDKCVEGEKTFQFTYCYQSPEGIVDTTQEQIFQDVGKHIVEHSLSGFNACVLAYGQTGSGKTYTMLGSDDSPGLIPRICESLFEHMKFQKSSCHKFKVESSFMEIYNERVRDLLSNDSGVNLRVREHPKQGPYVEGLSLRRVETYRDIEDLVQRGSKRRFTAATNMNDVSSRSHAIFTLHLQQIQYNEETKEPRELYSKIHLVDLAGSERAAAAGSAGDRLREGGHINKSLSALGLVIHGLSAAAVNSINSSSTPFIPYRDSILTWLLKDSLGGNSHTVMVATVSPAADSYNETLSTLRYASRAMSILNKPVVNEDPQTRLIKQLREEIARLNVLLACRNEGSQSNLVNKLEETRAKEQLLTETLQHRWEDFQEIFGQQDNLRISRTLSGSGIILDCQQPHLVCLESEDSSRSGIVLYNIYPGTMTIGSGCENTVPDILVSGSDVAPLHCSITLFENQVTLEAFSTCFVNGYFVTGATNLSPGSLITLGENTVFRYKDPRCGSEQKLKRSLASLNSSPVHHMQSPNNLLHLSGDVREAVELLRSLASQNSLIHSPTAISPTFSDTESENCSTPLIYSNRSGMGSKRLRSYSAWNLSFPASDYSEVGHSSSPRSFPLSRSLSVDSSTYSTGMACYASRGTLQVAVTDFSLTGSGRWSHYEYQIRISAGNLGTEKDSYSIWRRYSKFRELHSYLSRKFGEPVSMLYFPPRKWFGNNSERTAKERRHLLEAYLRRLVEVCGELPSSPLYTCKSKQALMNLAPFFRQGIFESSMCYQI